MKGTTLEHRRLYLHGSCMDSNNWVNFLLRVQNFHNQ